MTVDKKKILQQVLEPIGGGGVTAEYRALRRSSLTKLYDFIPMILYNPHKGISFRDVRHYYRIIKKVKPDIVQVRGANLDGLNAVIAAKLAHAKVMYCIHGIPSDNVYISKPKRMLFRYLLEPLGYMLSDGISCVYSSGGARSNFRHFQRKVLPYVYNRMDPLSIDPSDLKRKFCANQIFKGMQ